MVNYIYKEEKQQQIFLHLSALIPLLNQTNTETITIHLLSELPNHFSLRQKRKKRKEKHFSFESNDKKTTNTRRIVPYRKSRATPQINDSVVFKGNAETNSRIRYRGSSSLSRVRARTEVFSRVRARRGMGILIWGMNLTRCWRCWHYACRPFCHVVAKVYFLIRAWLQQS